MINIAGTIQASSGTPPATPAHSRGRALRSSSTQRTATHRPVRSDSGAARPAARCRATRRHRSAGAWRRRGESRGARHRPDRAPGAHGHVHGHGHGHGQRLSKLIQRLPTR